MPYHSWLAKWHMGPRFSPPTLPPISCPPSQPPRSRPPSSPPRQVLVLLQAVQNPVKPTDPGLRAKQVPEAQALESEVYAALEETPEGGKAFAAGGGRWRHLGGAIGLARW